MDIVIESKNVSNKGNYSLYGKNFDNIIFWKNLISFNYCLLCCNFCCFIGTERMYNVYIYFEMFTDYIFIQSIITLKMVNTIY